MSEAVKRSTEAALVDLAHKEGEHPVLMRTGAEDTPLVYDSPHSGRYYPEDFNSVVSLDMLREYEDRFVDLLIEDGAEHGAAVIAANFPRAYIDPNRASDDLDETMFETVWPQPLAPTRHSRSGTGLIFRKMQDHTPIYDRQLSIEEAKRRIAECWQPYHATLQSELERAMSRHGAVWHVNWHSMRPVGTSLAPDPGRERADFVLGDLQGLSCDPAFTSLVAETLEAMGYSVSINDPYQGAYIVQRYGRPEEGCHSLQIEINRALYMDLTTLEKIGRFEEIKRDIGHLSQRLAEWVRKQGRRTASVAK
jgi:N-formylglutamate deformylase